MYNYYLKGLIKNSGITQGLLAKMVGVSDATMSLLLAGKPVAKKHKQMVADYFNMPYGKLFKGE